ncbi:unnamed protein product [Diplocarpon coronariae]
MGFVQSLADLCLFTYAERGIKLLLYVDDIAAAAKTTTQLDWFFMTIRKRFNTKDLGGIHKILGIRVTRNRSTRELWLDQEQYIEKILDRMGLSAHAPNFKPKRTPIEGNQNLKDSTIRYENAVKRLGRYLRSTITQKVRYGLTKHTSAKLKVYTDSDWANMKGWKSISGSYIGRDRNCIDLRADNTGAIALAKNPHLHERSKHIDIAYHFIRDLVAKNKLSITYVPTDRMVADGFTKPLETVAKFEAFKDMLGYALIGLYTYPSFLTVIELVSTSY